jgi:hypothetical protein
MWHYFKEIASIFIDEKDKRTINEIAGQFNVEPIVVEAVGRHAINTLRTMAKDGNGLKKKEKEADELLVFYKNRKSKDDIEEYINSLIVK